jgi:hypothetical protein
MFKVVDSETGTEKWIDSSSERLRREYELWWNTHITLIRSIFLRCGVDSSEISTDEDYVKPLMKLFKSR